MTHDELIVIIEAHDKWLRGDADGVRANLCRANLCRANLQGANLCRANLCRANLRNANLQGANLQGANLRYADLRYADLRYANLRYANLDDADLRYAIGNMAEVRSMQADRWSVTWTSDTMTIGCKHHPIADWFAFSDREINAMDTGALKWWRKWKPILQQIIETTGKE